MVLRMVLVIGMLSSIRTSAMDAVSVQRSVRPKILEVGPDEIDIFREEPVAFVKHEERKKIRYSCAPCRPGYGAEPAPCVGVCEPKAISHSEGWKILYGHK